MTSTVYTKVPKGDYDVASINTLISDSRDAPPEMTCKNYVISGSAADADQKARIPRIQYVAAFTATILMFAVGTTFGWPGPALVHLSEPASTLQASPTQLSWVAAITSLGAMIGPVFGVLAVDAIGRKVTLLLTAVPFLIAWLLIALARTIHMLYVARLIAGIAAGVSLHVIPMYLGEIASPSIRGILSNAMTVQCNLGIFMAYALGPYVTIQTNACICAIIPVLFFVTFVGMPESPYFYLSKDEDVKAAAVLKKLRGKRCNVPAELAMISEAINNQKETTNSLYSLLFIASNRKALIISFVLFFAQQCAGITALMAYAPTIFKSLNAAIPASVSGIALAGTSVLTTLISGFLIDSLGRKLLLIVSSFSTAVPLFVIGLFFYLQRFQSLDIASLALIPTIALIVFPFTYGIGISSLPYVCTGELFPTNVKALAMFITSSYSSILAFTMVKMYQVVEDTMGLHVIFWFFMFASLLSGIFTIFCIPETKCRTLEEIQNELKK